MWFGDALDNMALDVLNDHDGVVDNQASSQGDAKQSQRVDRKSQYFDENKGSDEGNRNSDCRDKRGAPVLQENVNYKYHKANCLKQRNEDLFDRFADYFGSVECNGVF